MKKTTKVFSVEDSSLSITPSAGVQGYDRDLCCLVSFPESVIFKPKSDEKLAEELYPISPEIDGGIEVDSDTNYLSRQGFIAGRKSYGDKEFHLTREGLNLFAEKVWNEGQSQNLLNFDKLLDLLKDVLTPIIYPTRIIVEHDGENYLWETLKCSYE